MLAMCCLVNWLHLFWNIFHSLSFPNGRAIISYSPASLPFVNNPKFGRDEQNVH